MSKADTIFVDMCRDILDNGYSTEGQDVRARWEDGSSAYTIKRFGIVNRYDLSKEFPALTLRPTGWKNAIDELLWIWQKKTNDIAQTSKSYLGCLGQEVERCDRKGLRAISWASSTTFGRGEWIRWNGHVIRQLEEHAGEPEDYDGISTISKIFPRWAWSPALTA